MGGNKVVCLKTRTLLTCFFGKKSDLVEFLFGEGIFFWGGKFFGGRYRGFFGGGIKF